MFARGRTRRPSLRARNNAPPRRGRRLGVPQKFYPTLRNDTEVVPYTVGAGCGSPVETSAYGSMQKHRPSRQARPSVPARARSDFAQTQRRNANPVGAIHQASLAKGRGDCAAVEGFLARRSLIKLRGTLKAASPTNPRNDTEVGSYANIQLHQTNYR